MKAVVPAAGAGTRLRPLTDDRPKGLVSVAGQPLLAHCFDRLGEIGVDEVVVVVGYLGEQIRARFGDHYGELDLSYVTQGDRLGLAHAIQQAEPRIDGQFVVLNGDNVVGGSLRPLVEAHSPTDVTLLVEEVSPGAARETGVVVVDLDGNVTRLVEKPDDPPSTLVLAGCCVLPPTYFDSFRTVDPSGRGEYELPDVVNRLLANGHEVRAVRHDDWRVNVNTAADLRIARERLGASE